MTYTTWTIIRRFGSSLLMLALALWTAAPVYAYRAGGADITTVRAVAEQLCESLAAEQDVPAS